MVDKRRLLKRILSSSKNVRVTEMVGLIEAFGFQLARDNGSYHIFVHPAVTELLNLQNVRGKDKPYRIRQFLRLVER